MQWKWLLTVSFHRRRYINNTGTGPWGEEKWNVLNWFTYRRNHQGISKHTHKQQCTRTWQWFVPRTYVALWGSTDRSVGDESGVRKHLEAILFTVFGTHPGEWLQLAWGSKKWINDLARGEELGRKKDGRHKGDKVRKHKMSRVKKEKRKKKESEEREQSRP